MTPTDDREMLPEQLESKYSSGDSWGHHPKYPREDWQHEVADGDTIAGYWVWVATQLSYEEDEEDEVP